MNYSRLGAYQKLKITPKRGLQKQKQQVDWLNIILLIILFIVAVLFIFNGN